jgi:predicted alpha/beta-hydrolase family hydrolase
MTVLDIDTPKGQAKAHLHLADEPRAALVLGHGAGGGVTSPDLTAVTSAARSEGLSVALVEQPYRVAGRRSPPPVANLDSAWVAVVEYLIAGELSGLPLVVGGRSLGARVACRTAAETGAAGVLCLAFPLQPRSRSATAPKSRLSELDAVTVPTLVVQGDRDPFGLPPAGKLRTVVQVPGDHSLRKDTEAVAAAVRDWLSIAPLAAAGQASPGRRARRPGHHRNRAGDVQSQPPRARRQEDQLRRPSSP